MLTGKAKTDYQRNYMRDWMRRKRAGLPTATKPKPQRRLDPAWLRDQIAYWVRIRDTWKLRDTGRRVIDGLSFETEADWQEACRRYWAIRDGSLAPADPPKPRIKHCSFCRKSGSEVAKLIEGRGGVTICDRCIAQAARLVAERKATPGAGISG
jgi:hypothetical protein